MIRVISIKVYKDAFLPKSVMMEKLSLPSIMQSQAQIQIAITAWKTKAVDSNISKIIDVLQEAMEPLQVLKIILNQSVQGLMI